MLTLEYIVKVTRLLDQTGEPRAGFLHDGIANFEGAPPVVEDEAHTAPSEEQEKNDSEICLDYEKDPVTGDVKIVYK